MAILGIGMGLLAAQLGNVAQSSVGDQERSEVGGLQYTAQNLGSSLGTALIGSVVVGALTVTALGAVQSDPRISATVKDQVGVAVSGNVQFVPVEQVQQALANAQVPLPEADAIIAAYIDAQLQALRIALLAAAAIALLSLFLTRGLPRAKLTEPAGARPTPARQARAARP
jgi:hypothetical protein